MRNYNDQELKTLLAEMCVKQPEHSEEELKNLSETARYIAENSRWDREAVAGVIESVTIKDNNKTELQLSFKTLDDLGVRTLAAALKHPNCLVVTIKLCGCYLTDNVKYLAQALENKQTITEIHLQKNQIADEGAEALANLLVRNHNITKLYLHNNEIGDKGAKALAPLLESGRIQIDLYINKIGDEGATAIAQALENNRTYKSLDLKGNKIGNEGAIALAQMLKTNRTLENIELGNNVIEDAGVIALAQALEINYSLKTILLDHNRIENAGIEAFAKMLERNQTIQTIDFDWNYFTYEGVKAIIMALKGNHSLKDLSLFRSTINDCIAIMKDLIESLEVNNTITSVDYYLNRRGEEESRYGNIIYSLLNRNKNIQDSINSDTHYSPNIPSGNLSSTSSALVKCEEEIKNLQLLLKQNQEITNRGVELSQTAYNESLKTREEINRVQEKYKVSALDMQEIDLIGQNPNLLTYYQAIQKIFNEAFLTASVISSGKLITKPSDLSEIINTTSSLVGDVIPFSSLVLSGISAVVNAIDSASLKGKYQNISDLNPTSSPIDAAIFCEKLARRFTISCQRQVENTAGQANSQDIKAIEAFIQDGVKKIFGETTRRGMFSKKLTSVEALAFQHSSLALNYIADGRFKESIENKKAASDSIKEMDDNVENIIHHVIGNIQKLTVSRQRTRYVSVTTTETMSFLDTGKVSSQIEDLQEKSLRFQEEAKSEISRLRQESKTAHEKASRAENTINSVFQTFVGDGEQVTKSAKFKDRAHISVSNPGLEDRFANMETHYNLNQERLDEMQNEINYLKMELENRDKNSKNSSCCSIS